MAERAREQAYRFGAEILLHRTGVRGEFHAGRGVGYLDDGTKIIARASVCATGVEYRRLNLPNEDRLLGAGVYYGAGASEASLCSNEHVVLVGAGNSSAQASLHLARYAAKVTIVMRGDCLKANVSDYLVHRIQTTPNIEVLPNTVVTALHGDGFLHAVTIRNLKTFAQVTGGTTMQWQERFQRARAEWMLLTFYERFEQIIILILTGLIAIIVVFAVWNLTLKIFHGVIAPQTFDPSEYSVFQAVFGAIFTVIIALEFKRSLLVVAQRQESIVLLALLAIVRKVMILDLASTEALQLFALAAAILALGAVYWLVRDQDRSIERDQSPQHRKPRRQSSA